MANDAKFRTGGCHCGAVRFEVTLSDGFNSIRRCTCSFCRMRGAVVTMAEMGGIRFLQGEETLTGYRFHTGIGAAFLLLALRDLHAPPAATPTRASMP